MHRNKITVVPTNIPDELKSYDQWVCWKYSIQATGRSHRPCKIPVCPATGGSAKSTTPATWSSFDTALEHYVADRPRLAGIGFVFSKDDPFVGVDLDHCRDPRAGTILPWAISLLGSIGSYAEISPSGTGVKCILRAHDVDIGRRCTYPPIEIYSSNRFFTVTGHVLKNYRAVTEATDAIQAIREQYFPDDVGGLDPDVHSVPQRFTDEEILRQAHKAKNSPKFKMLWNGDATSQTESHSQADLSLCRILAFWCGPCPSQIDRLFRKSKLFRDKWDERHFASGSTYGKETIRRAIAAQAGVFFGSGINAGRRLEKASH